MDPDSVKDFFISYNKADRAWAEWISGQLEEQGYSCIVQAWDFRPGGNFVLDMHHASTGAQRTVAVLSPDYLSAVYTQPEWAAAFVQDPMGKEGALLPIRVRECQPEGILAAIVYIDLVALDESNACAALSAGVKRIRAKPSGPLPFPGGPSSMRKLAANFPGNWPEVWEVPYRRNAFFTGRDELLKRLYEKLSAQKTMALTQQAQAISGLGGIGKTQTALEYAYRHQSKYRYVLWATAETAEGLSAEYVRLAELLQVPGRDEKDQTITVRAFKRWSGQQSDWLLILDNADEVEMVRGFLPEGPQMKGHMILTTRAQALGNIADTIDIEKMEKEEGVEFLLRRARVRSGEASERAAAETIVEELDGFPLALDQAGAYIEETGCSLADYLKMYQTRRKELLKRRGRLVKDHPETVATTWDLALKKVEQANRVSVALLKLCAFLAPDAIQEEMIMAGAKYLGKELAPVAADEFMLNEAIEVLRRYSLVKRNQATKALSMHRLVQAVLKDGMDGEEQQQWAQRVMQMVSKVFPIGVYDNWEPCRRYLPHARICMELMKHYQIEVPEATWLLHNVGYYFYEQREHKQAEECHRQALSLKEKIFGAEHRQMAVTLHELARLAQVRRDYSQAEQLYRQALAIKEQVTGRDHSGIASTASTYHALAMLFHERENYEEAKKFYKQALATYEKAYGLEHPDAAITLYSLASLYQNQGNDEEAEPLYKQVLSIYEKTHGLEHPYAAATFHELGRLYQRRHKDEEAREHYEQALAIYEKTHGLEHPYTGITLHELGRLYQRHRKYEEAREHYEQALAIYEKTLGVEHPYRATTLHNLGWLYQMQKKYEEAKEYYRKALSIREKVFGLEHGSTISTLKNYAYLLYQIDCKAEAEALLARVNLTVDDFFS